MKKYLISLDKDIQRRELFFSQPDTADFEVFSAVNTMRETPEQLAAWFDMEKFSQRYHRKVTKGEIGCTLSHLRIYEKILRDEHIQPQEYVLICEDDALFAPHFQTTLEAILAEHLTADIILTGQSKIGAFNHIDLELNYPTTFRFRRHKVANTQVSYSYPYRNYFAGTVCYLIKKSAAAKFLAQTNNERKPYWLADDFILFADSFSVDSLFIRPLLAIENPNIGSNLENLRGSVKNNLMKKLLKYPLKKVLAIKRNW
ncbi:glycosyltransferase family 25 protein [Pasteurellaceae bacterium LIM206]|nr:glycosyltransferase family 25 protein [Pasteurellaceae bacterium LIM206]